MMVQNRDFITHVIKMSHFLWPDSIMIIFRALNLYANIVIKYWCIQITSGRSVWGVIMNHGINNCIILKLISF